MNKFSPEQRSLIREIEEELRETIPSSRERNKQIIERVKKDFDMIIDNKDIYDICRRVDKLKSSLQKIGEAVSEKKPYSVETRDGELSYVFKKNISGTVHEFSIPVAEIDEMFHDFSKYGGNLTEEQMLDKYQIKPEVWYMIKSRLRLYKTSNVISPYTAENAEDEVLEEKVVQASARHIDTLKGRMIKTHEKLKDKEYKEAMAFKANYEYRLEHLKKTIESYKPRKIDFVPEKFEGNGSIQVAISDIHIGKRGTKAIKERLQNILSDIANRPEKEINILCLGDLVESIAPLGMHKGMERSMELHGFELLMETVQTFEEFILAIYKMGRTVSFDGIPGNHDRFGEGHDEDSERMGGLVIYEMIRRGLANTEVKVEFHRQKITNLRFGNVSYSIHHGDDGFSSRNIHQTLWNHGSQSRYNVILHGDKHNVTMKNVKNALLIGLPALAGSGEYDTKLDLASDPGYVIIEENRFKKINATINLLD